MLPNSAASAFLGARCSFIVLRLAQFCRCKQQEPPLESGLHLEGEGDGHETHRRACVGELVLVRTLGFSTFIPLLRGSSGQVISRRYYKCSRHFDLLCYMFWVDFPFKAGCLMSQGHSRPGQTGAVRSSRAEFYRADKSEAS